MRKTQAVLALTLLIGAAGCPPDGGRFNLLRPNGGGGGGGAVNPSAETPTKEDLVAYLNALSTNNPGIKSNDISLTCYMDSAIGIPIGGKIAAQGARNFRMVADSPMGQEVDLGSNEQEFWYWIKRSGDPQVFCSYQAMEQGQVKRMPFPFQPDWVLEAMSMGKYGPADKYTLAVEKDSLKLIEKTKSPQGMPVKKIIVFNRARANTNPPSNCAPQITDFLLVEDASNKLICSAHISKRQIIGKTEIPRELELKWPEAKMRLVLHLNNIELNSPQHPIQPQVYVRTQLKGIGSYDMATGRMEGVQQAGGAKINPK